MLKQAKFIGLASWNCGAQLHNKTNELTRFLADYKIKILLIQETWLKPDITFHIPNYFVYRSDRFPEPHGGTAILVHKSIPHTPITLPPLQNIEATAIEVSFNNKTLSIISAYKRPKVNILNSDLNLLFATAKCVILAGDLNAKCTEWGCKANNSAGGALLRFITSSPSLIISPPSSPTHLLNQLPHDILDITIHSCSLPMTSPQTLFELSSDHLPIYFLIYSDLQEITQPTTRHFDVNWLKYRSRLSRMVNTNMPLDTSQDVDSAINHLSSKIKSAHFVSSTPSTSTTNSTLPFDILELIRLKRKAQRTFYRTRDTTDKRTFLTIRRLLSEKLQLFRNSQWKTMLARTNIKGSDDFWRVVKPFKTPKIAVSALNIPDTNDKTYDTSHKTKIFADLLQQRFLPTPLSSIPFPPDPLLDVIDYSGFQFLDTEVWAKIKKINTKKSSGPDNITGQQIKNLTKPISKFITAIFNTCIRLNYFPSAWKQAKIIMLPKPNKSTLEPNNYRPISLLSQLSKIFERLILDRLQLFLEKNEILNPSQFGFRKSRSSSLQAFRLAQEVASTLTFKCSIPAIFFDFSFAFDKVHHHLLISKLSLILPLPWLFILASFLSNRSFFVSLYGFKSSVRPIQGGVPQGSPLSPTLFSLYINDLPSFTNTSTYLYADDLALTVKRRGIQAAITTLQAAVDELVRWCCDNGIGINAEKCQAIIFTWKNLLQPTNLYVANTHIAWQKEIKYLGITFDSKLKWHKHIFKTRQKMLSRFFALKPLFKSPTICTDHRLFLYKTLIRSIALYGLEVFATASNNSLNLLQFLENRVIRTAVNPPRGTTNKNIRQNNDVTPLRQVIYEMATQRVTEMMSSETDTVLCHKYKKYVGRINPKKNKLVPTDILNQLPPDIV